MKKLTIILLSLSLVASVWAEDNKRDTSFDVVLSTDPFFGFNILASGAIPLTDQWAFNVYGLFWTDVGAGLNNNPWTEFGGGITYQIIPELSASLLLGMLNGDLQSQSDTASVGEAVVPNLTIDYSGSMLEGQIYTGFYKTLSAQRENRGPISDYLHGWVNLGYVFSQYFSAGVHYEQLENMGTYAIGSTSSDGKTSNIYQWIGLYGETKFPNQKAALRYTGGLDLAEGREHFYKLSLAMSL